MLCRIYSRNGWVLNQLKMLLFLFFLVKTMHVLYVNLQAWKKEFIVFLICIPKITINQKKKKVGKRQNWLNWESKYESDRFFRTHSHNVFDRVNRFQSKWMNLIRKLFEGCPALLNSSLSYVIYFCKMPRGQKNSQRLFHTRIILTFMFFFS